MSHTQQRRPWRSGAMRETALVSGGLRASLGVMALALGGGVITLSTALSGVSSPLLAQQPLTKEERQKQRQQRQQQGATQGGRDQGQGQRRNAQQPQQGGPQQVRERPRRPGQPQQPATITKQPQQGGPQQVRERPRRPGQQQQPATITKQPQQGGPQQVRERPKRPGQQQQPATITKQPQQGGPQQVRERPRRPGQQQQPATITKQPQQGGPQQVRERPRRPGQQQQPATITKQPQQGGPQQVRERPRRPGQQQQPATTTAPFVPKGGQQRPGIAPAAPRPSVVVRDRPRGTAIRIDAIRAQRVVNTDSRGRRIIVEPGNRTIIRHQNRVIVHRNEAAFISRFHPRARVLRRPGGLTETFVVRSDGVRVVSVVDGSGRLVRRYGVRPGGRRFVFVDNRRFYRNLAIGVGVAAIGVGAVIALAPPAIAIPRDRYIVDYGRADDDLLYETLMAPPVDRLERRYSLDEVRYSVSLRDRMRRIDIDTITFDTGSYEISPDQYRNLERMARAILRAIEKDPAETFLIEGHTDAVGEPEDNASLSDRRAEAVAQVLIEEYRVPVENLATQGYGEQHLKVDTPGPERANRRVSFRRITPLLNQEEDVAEDREPPQSERRD
jgi:outer membrane protein OmpA-like peptidoglycan-associated protein